MKSRFVKEESRRFSTSDRNPFRVAISGDRNGRAYPYGSHAEPREYADMTIGYAVCLEEAVQLLEEAYDEAQRTNKYWAEH